jgi:hypothetical protein
MTLLQLQIFFNDLHFPYPPLTLIDEDKFPILFRHWPDLVPIGVVNQDIKTVRWETSNDQH